MSKMYENFEKQAETMATKAATATDAKFVTAYSNAADKLAKDYEEGRRHEQEIEKIRLEHHLKGELKEQESKDLERKLKLEEAKLELEKVRLELDKSKLNYEKEEAKLERDLKRELAKDEDRKSRVDNIIKIGTRVLETAGIVTTAIVGYKTVKMQTETAERMLDKATAFNEVDVMPTKPTEMVDKLQKLTK